MQIEKIPFVISVTGHRDLTAEEMQGGEVRVEAILKYFCELKSLRHTPIWVFSSLADGADRCVARVALRLRDSGQYNIRVIAPLPFEHDVYTQDFCDSSIEEFEQLLAQMNDVFVLDPYEYEGFDASRLPLPPPEKRNAHNDWGYSPERNAQYVNLGAFLVRHANILLALWDGKLLNNFTGGTGEVVMAMMNQPMDWGTTQQGQKIPPRKELQERQTFVGGESGAVIHIPVHRNGTNNHVESFTLEDQRPPWVKHWPDNAVHWYFSLSLMTREGLSDLVKYSQDELQVIMLRINEFNTALDKRSAHRSQEDIGKQLKKSWIQPIDYTFKPVVSRIRDCYRSADWCALSMQIKARWLLKIFFFSVLMTIAGYDAFSRLGASGSQLGYYSLMLFLLGVFFITIIFIFSKKVVYKRKFHDFRLYAELMRISSYLSYLGLNRRITEFFSPDTRSITAWLEHARRTAEYKTWDKENLKSDCTLEEMNNIKHWWINDQLAYYAGKIGSSKRAGKKQNLITRYIRIRTVSWLFYFIGAGMTAYIAVHYFLGNVIVADDIWLNMVFFGTSAAIAKWGDLLGYKDDATRYTLARSMYEWAALEFDDLLKAEDLPRLKGIAQELARQAVSENTRWYISQSARDISINLK